MVKNPPANAGGWQDMGLSPRPGRPPGGGNGSPVKCSCLGNPKDRWAWWTAVPGIPKSQAQPSTHMQELRESPLSLLWGPPEKSQSAAHKSVLTGPHGAGPDLRLPASRTVRNTSLLFRSHPADGVLLTEAWQTTAIYISLCSIIP